MAPKTQASKTSKRSSKVADDGAKVTKAQPRRPPTRKTYTRLEGGRGLPTPIDVLFEGTSSSAKGEKDDSFTHLLKLSAPSTFTISKTVMIHEGEYEGHQAILLHPAKAFPIMDLPEEVRSRVFRHYLRPTSDSGILVDGKRSSTREIYAKKYADGSKNRVALLAASQVIYKSASPILYSLSFRFESTATVAEFMSQVSAKVRSEIQHVIVGHYQKPTARMALNILAECSKLQDLTFEQGVFSGDDIAKAGTSFYNDASKFLEAKATNDNPHAGVDCLRFGRQAFVVKNGEDMGPWEEDSRAEFIQFVKDKLK